MTDDGARPGPPSVTCPPVKEKALLHLYFPEEVTGLGSVMSAMLARKSGWSYVKVRKIIWIKNHLVNIAFITWGSLIASVCRGAGLFLGDGLTD